MARIERAWWQPFRIPLRRPIAAAHGTIVYREGILLGLEWQGGVAIGEASPFPSFGGGDIAECIVELRRIGRVLTAPAAELWMHPPGWGEGLSRGSRGALACGLETALAGILSEEAGLPLWRWLAEQAGIGTDSAPGPIPVNALIDATDATDAATEARAAVERGYTTLKVKVGRDARADEERVAAVHEAGGPGIALRVDANGAWGVEEAIERLRRYQQLGVVLAEQPTPAAGPGALEALAAVRAATRVMIAADESCGGPADAQQVIAARAADVLVVKPMVTGLQAAAEVIAIGIRAGMPSIVTTSFDTGVGTMAAVHLAALLPETRLACGLGTLSALTFDIADGAPADPGGRLPVPAVSGLAVAVDEAALERAAIGPREYLTP